MHTKLKQVSEVQLLTLRSQVSRSCLPQVLVAHVENANCEFHFPKDT